MLPPDGMKQTASPRTSIIRVSLVEAQLVCRHRRSEKDSRFVPLLVQNKCALCGVAATLAHGKHIHSQAETALPNSSGRVCAAASWKQLEGKEALGGEEVDISMAGASKSWRIRIGGIQSTVETCIAVLFS